MVELTFFKEKRVLITGHTGFKGSWMSHILARAGAVVTGYALDAPTDPNLFSLLKLQGRMHSVIGDVRDFDTLKKVFDSARPEIVIHMAAQPIVRESYKAPRETYETNVMGTVNVLECIRLTESVRSAINVTTDKVYLNREWPWGYREDEMLDGYDPYSNSKSCSELATHSYVSSFFAGNNAPAVSTARAGNVIGGGDFASDRIIPDCVRAAVSGKDIIVRNPYSTRPYQHVLEPETRFVKGIFCKNSDHPKRIAAISYVPQFFSIESFDQPLLFVVSFHQVDCLEPCLIYSYSRLEYYLQCL